MAPTQKQMTIQSLYYPKTEYRRHQNNSSVVHWNKQAAVACNTRLWQHIVTKPTHKATVIIIREKEEEKN